MPRLTRFALAFALLLTSTFAHTQIKWIEPVPAELSMKSDPKAPGAPAVILSYEETDNAITADRVLHLRIKVLTTAGLSAGNIELPARFSAEAISHDIFARTIHADGSIYTFTNTQQNSAVLLERDLQPVTHDDSVIALPSVEVGSILECIIQYRVFTGLIGTVSRYYAPSWRAQRPLFMHSAHFTLIGPDQIDPETIRWVARLPPGIAPRRVKSRVDLDLTDVPAVADEDFAPPLAASLYNVRFFYNASTRDKYWGEIGNLVDYSWSFYYQPRKLLITAVHDLILPTDTDEQKLRRIYAVIMSFENTDFTRAFSEAEIKKNNLREVHSSDDVWVNKRGNSVELTLLFIALARAAGLHAYPMAITSRSVGVFDQEVLSWSQTDATIAIVTLNNRDLFFDPGTRFCPFGSLAPGHVNVMGVSIEGKLVKIRYTPNQLASAARFDRNATLTLDSTGQVTGDITITWTGVSGLFIRLAAQSLDQTAVQTAVEKLIQLSVPSGIQIKLTSLTGLTDTQSPLIAKGSVTGTLGTRTKTRIILPAQFFMFNSRAVLSSSTRTQPITFPGAGSERDLLTLKLPSTVTVESLPEVQSLAYQSDSLYRSSAQFAEVQGDADTDPPVPTLILQRSYVLHRIDYPAAVYPQLHTYFEQIAAHDQEQIVLKTTSNPPAEPQVK